MLNYCMLNYHLILQCILHETFLTGLSPEAAQVLSGQGAVPTAGLRPVAHLGTLLPSHQTPPAPTDNTTSKLLLR